MPVYKGSNEVSSGNLKKGSTNIENGYKQTDQFYVNTNAIIINFVDAISGATMDTTQFSSTGTPGASFASFTRTITTDSGRIFQGTVSVAESGDTGNNVTASISGQGSTTATLNVSGTYPATGVTVTLTVNGATQLALPDLNVSNNGNYPTIASSDSVALGTVNYSASNSSGCVGGTSGSGTFNAGSSNNYTYYSYSKPSLAGGPYGNGCGQTCNATFSASKSGYNSGSTTFSTTGGYPSSSGTITANILCVGYNYNGTWTGFNSCPGGIFPAAAQPQSIAATCAGTACDPNNNPPAANSCSGQTTGMPTIDTNNFTLNQGSSPVSIYGVTNGASQDVQYTISGIVAQWTITCPGGGAGMSAAQLVANCTLQQNGTNITITPPQGGTLTLGVTGASGACSTSNPPLVCGGGNWGNINGTPTPYINVGCTRPPCQ